MKLKLNLLLMILENVPSPNKYTKAFLNIKNVIALEKEDGVEVHQSRIEKFKIIEKKYKSFINKIPLLIVERYFFENHSNSDLYCYLEYKGNELTDLKIIELYEILEEYFILVFDLATEFANDYNLEIKLNSKNNKFESEYF